jgi:hypothetical protein
MKNQANLTAAYESKTVCHGRNKTENAAYQMILRNKNPKYLRSSYALCR